MRRCDPFYLIPVIRFRSAHGYSLPELLVALAVAGIVMAAAGAMLGSHMLTVRRIERAQRERDNANRLNYLVQIEASEAARVDLNPALDANCEGSGNALFALRVPKSTGVYGSEANVSTVFYYNFGGDVRRCGPPVLQNGVLDHDYEPSEIQDGIAVRGATMQLVQSAGVVGCDSQVSSDRQVVYTLSFTDSGYTPSCVVARARTVFVCNPPVPGQTLEPGDCAS